MSLNANNKRLRDDDESTDLKSSLEERATKRAEEARQTLYVNSLVQVCSEEIAQSEEKHSKDLATLSAKHDATVASLKQEIIALEARANEAETESINKTLQLDAAEKRMVTQANSHKKDKADAASALQDEKKKVVDLQASVSRIKRDNASLKRDHQQDMPSAFTVGQPPSAAYVIVEFKSLHKQNKSVCILRSKMFRTAVGRLLDGRRCTANDLFFVYDRKKFGMLSVAYSKTMIDLGMVGKVVVHFDTHDKLDEYAEHIG